MDSFENAVDENLDHCQETFGAAEVDYVNVIELLDGSLDAGEVDVDGDGETQNAGGSEGVDHVRRLDACNTFEEVMAMEFDSPEAAVRFYKQYSRGKGFSMRLGRKLRNKNGDVIRYTFLCNRQGFREKKWLEMPGRKREHKTVTRCGCAAEMRIKPKDGTGLWYVSRFVDQHNHELLPPKFVDHLPSYRRMSDLMLLTWIVLGKLGSQFLRFMSQLLRTLADSSMSHSLRETCTMLFGTKDHRVTAMLTPH